MHKKTFVPAVTTETRWWLLDAEGQTLGRLATKISQLLRGRTRADFTAHQNSGDHVIVVNAADFVVSGRKESDKKYYDHSGYRGGLKSATLAELRQTDPLRPLRDAVTGMMPKNRLARAELRNLHLFETGEHPHDAQKPVKVDLSR